MTGKKPLNGYLDRMNRNIHALDEGIEQARIADEKEYRGERRARVKLLRDLIELQNSTLTIVKSYLLGEPR